MRKLHDLGRGLTSLRSEVWWRRTCTSTSADDLPFV
jgi:hypothetical protein